MENNIAIKIDDVSKMYKLYDKPSDRLRDGLGLTRKKRYKEHWALHHVNLEVKKGETIGIIGTNGSGKSTILKIITGVLNPTLGEVKVEGRISALLELGAGFNMEYTGIENVYLNGMMIGFSREEIDARMDDILKFADIGDFVYQPCKTYSSGMFVRLAFAVAINIDPEILIVDEALSVGDAFFQAKCYKKFEDFKKQGKTIIFVSHDISSVAKYCDRVVLLNKGEKLFEGTPKDTIDLYKRVLLNQTTSSQEGKIRNNGDGVEEEGQGIAPQTWKSNYVINPDVNEYGTGEAEIVDFAIIDQNGTYTNCIEKGTPFMIKTKVLFMQEVSQPIFTYTFKDLQGTAITGTNTMYEKVDAGTVHPGEVYVASFEQNMDLQGGEYLLSISCTGYVEGNFRAYHRLYDVCSVTVVSNKNTVGYYDMNSVASVERIK